MTTIPTDGPDAVLSRIATLLKLPQGRDQILLALAAHPRPTSLLALVDVAGQLGLKITPAKTTEGALEDLTFPFVAHFDSNGGGGFAVVESMSPSGVEVWDSRQGVHTLERSRFVEHWSGIVALIDREGSTSEHAPLRRRLIQLVVGGTEPPSVAEGPAALPLRIALAALVTALVGLGIASQPQDLRVPTAALALLSLAGVALAAIMSVAISDYGGPFSPGICRRGKLVDCQSVLTSRFARVFGVPLSELGISFYAAALLLIAASAAGASAPKVLGVVYVATVPAAVVLIGIQIAMRRLCTLCLAVHAINAAAAAIAWLFILDRGSPWKVEAFLLFALLFSLVLFFALPYLKKNHALARLTATYGRMSGSPFASLAQVATETPTGVTGPRIGVGLGSGRGEDELVAFVHPSCNQCEPVLREIASMAARDVVEIYVAIPPRDATERPLCEALIAIGLSAGPEAMLRAFLVAKERFKELLVVDPAPVLTAELGLAPDTIASVSENAGTITRYAETFAAEHVEGTPMVFFNSLPYRGPLAHLVALLETHRELLPKRPGLDRAPRS